MLEGILEKSGRTAFSCSRGRYPLRGMGENVGKQTVFTVKVEQVETFEKPVL